MVTTSTPALKHHIRGFRIWTAVLIVGLVLSGITAFPLVWELQLLTAWSGPAPEQTESLLDDLTTWLWTVRHGLEDAQSRYPWMAYGTDWLAFGHLVIALFFVGPLLWPKRDHRWTLITGMIACAGIVPLAMVAGEVRGIPWGWRLIDCGFAVGGILPLLLAYRHHRAILTG